MRLIFGSPLIELFKAPSILVYFGLGSAENYSPIYLLARALILVQDWLCPWSIRVQSYTAYMDDMTGNFFVLFCSTYGAQFWNVCEIVLDQSKWKPRNKLSSRSYLQRRKNNREMETTRGLDHLRMTNNLDCHSHMLFQSRMPTSKDFATSELINQANSDPVN